MVPDEQLRKERLQLLLQQIQLPKQIVEQHFAEGLIRKLQIDKQKRSWHFQIELKTIVPSAVYELFSVHLKQAFEHIAKVQFTFIYEQKSLSADEWQDYWPIIVTKLQSISDGIRQLLSKQVPKYDGRRLIINVRNETEAVALKRKVTESLQNTLIELSLPNVQLDTNIQESKQEYEQFVENRKKEDQSKVVEAILEKKKQEEQAEKKVNDKNLVIGYPIKDEPVMLESIQDEERRITVQGYVFASETRELRSGRTLLTFKITDYTDSILVKMFSRDKEDVPMLQAIKKGMWVKVRGGVQNDTFVRDLVMIGNDVNQITPKERQDTATEEEKRVELHLHTTMSQMDGIVSAGRYIEQAAKWGHKAIAITDHGVVQAFPEAYSAGKKNGVKVLFGIEANLVDDGVPIAYNEADRNLIEDEFVVFDVETTGLSAVYNTIIELAAVKIKDGEIVDRFESFADPHEPLSNTIIELTGITDDMVKGQPEVDEVLRNFKEFVGDAILVAHNASFDMGF